ncbi:Transcription factor-like protein [Hapsidospora chrysogenum ATCC 11550]|uniref:Transcription factor n=1 Tax=Hapsidospora chrysogenum (strain ATCC 11550 / CBS 779.69 / DSM 880 / IAM 14645 / JCM 23072 / IMI 49137) TaxID=857340 RepID=A0A086SUZ0_HAPC1|nr:Transcription factor-like protein [Hapsidospora chrysogenum ATCC 11550]
MLEDPSHQDVARWGKAGDTFVVVEGEKFTRSILPKHFKHSNMSSFIRQLNKYDFHKVKPSSSENDNSSPLGNVLEFKHPFFRIDSKEDLDNIRRKAPAPRKPQAADDYNTSQHLGVISEQLAATQQQVQQLQELYAEVSQTNKILVTEVVTLQKILNAQRQASHEIVNYLTPYDGQSNNNMLGQPSMTTNGQTGETDEVVPELRRARELLSSVNTDAVTDRELERLQNVYGSPTDSGAMVTPTSLPMMNDPMHDITRYPVYPVGQTVGIDPFHSDHIHKIPYAVPNDSSATTATTVAEQQQKQQQQRQQQQHVTQASNAPPPASAADKGESIWGPRKPRVLLVEDDPTCTKIGVKFLRSMGCEVEHAPDGAEAYTRISSSPNREHFDMVFMDIIMPRMDGVSATMYIRQSQPAIPIVAMTSNIRPEEVNGYFEHGMNGVLAKPFTRDGMWKSVRTHLGPLMKNPPPEADIGSGAGYQMSSGPYLNTAASIKLEAASPNAAGATWSANQMGQNSMGGMDQGYGFLNGSNPYSMASGHRSVYATAMQTGEPTPGRVSEVDSPPEKRQRLNQSAY